MDASIHTLIHTYIRTYTRMCIEVCVRYLVRRLDLGLRPPREDLVLQVAPAHLNKFTSMRVSEVTCVVETIRPRTHPPNRRFIHTYLVVLPVAEPALPRDAQPLGGRLDGADGADHGRGDHQHAAWGGGCWGIIERGGSMYKGSNEREDAPLPLEARRQMLAQHRRLLIPCACVCRVDHRVLNESIICNTSGNHPSIPSHTHTDPPTHLWATGRRPRFGAPPPPPPSPSPCLDRSCTWRPPA